MPNENIELELAKTILASIVKACNHKHFSSFVMHLEGGKMPKDESYYIPVIIYYDDAKISEFVAWCSGGSSRRVRLQTTLRDKCTTFTRARVSREGLVIHGRDVDEVPRTAKEKQMEVIAAVRVMKKDSPEEFKSFMETIKVLRDNK